MEECPNCWVILDTTQRTIKVYKGLEPQTIPPDIHTRLMTALTKEDGCQSQALTSHRYRRS